MRIRIPTSRKKQMAVGGVVLTTLGIVISGAVYMIEKNKQANKEQQQVTQKQQIVATDFTAPQKDVSEGRLWEVSEGARISEIDRKVEELRKEIERSNPNDGQSGPDGLGAPNGISGIDGHGGLPPRPQGEIPQGQAIAPNMNAQPTIRSLSLGAADGTAAPIANQQDTQGNGGSPLITGGQNGTTKVRKSANFKQSDEWTQVKGLRPNIEIVSDGGAISRTETSRAKFRARDSYIPSGTFFRSVLLGGIDAPTGGDAQNASPHPVLMRVTDFAQLPNRFKYNFRECFVTGNGYGDLSAERAYIRLQNLSCVGTDGRAIDMPIKGYVAGEDGKTGIRGTVVTKQGQILANALMAGVISGLGKGVSESFSVTNTTALGTAKSVASGSELRAGLANGIGSAADRLAEYYIKLADKVFPVVEINAGRAVDIVLTQGVEIDTGEEEQ